MKAETVVAMLSVAVIVLSNAGCMTSRGVCSVMSGGDLGHMETRNKYRISHVQEKLSDDRMVDVHSDRRMREMLDEADDLAEMSSYKPATWSDDGIPVTVTFENWRRDSGVHWTIVPCVLTLGICPYCHHEMISSRVVVSRDDGGGESSFEYVERDDWKMSFLFCLGSIPYSDRVLARNEFQSCGHGDVLMQPHFNGLAHGLVAALSEMERNTNLKK